jgi:hypothetical protein
LLLLFLTFLGQVRAQRHCAELQAFTWPSQEQIAKGRMDLAGMIVQPFTGAFNPEVFRTKKDDVALKYHADLLDQARF